MTTLYELTGIYKQALSELEGMDSDAVADTIEGLQGELIEKAQNVAAYMLNMDSDIDQISIAIKRLSDRKFVLQKKRDWMNEYLLRNMIASDISEIKANDGSFRARVQKGRESVFIEEGTMVPEGFVRIKIEPDRTALMQAMKNGASFAGIRLERKPSLKID